jgi:hypothetical protein
MGERGPKPGKAAVQAAIEAQAPPSWAPSGQLALAPELAAEEPTRGRPAGRRNRRTQELVDYLASQDALPGLVLARVLKAGPQQLARDLGVSLPEAFGKWLAIAETLMPYAHPRLAQLQVDATVSDASALHLLAVTGQAVDLELAADLESEGPGDGA